LEAPHVGWEPHRHWKPMPVSTAIGPYGRQIPVAEWLRPS